MANQLCRHGRRLSVSGLNLFKAITSWILVGPQRPYHTGERRATEIAGTAERPALGYANPRPTSFSAVMAPPMSMSEPNVQEPTMEEILASIRRIISEDEPAAEAAES